MLATATKPQQDYTTKRKDILKRKQALWNERSSWMSHWQEISTAIMPRNGRYVATDRNRGEKKHNTIYDSTATRALKVMAAGMMAGATSPARPWFRLMAADPELNSYHPVKLWLEDVTERIQRVFQKSNTYRALQQMYVELGAFGTAASIVLPDFGSVIHHHVLTIGEYALATDAKGGVDTLYREFDMTVAQVVNEFGRENCSLSVQRQFDEGNLDNWLTVVHAIQPRKQRSYGKPGPANMPWTSCYIELGGQEEKVLRESGFERFPVLAPRWDLSGGDIYGNSPGMEALGDVRQLQHEQLRKAESIDYQTKPPLQVPAGMVNRDVDTLPGGVTFYDQTNPQGGIRTAYEVQTRLDYLLEDIRDVRDRIRGAFFSDLFLMLANSTDATKTATEIAERHEEKMMVLGPVLERQQNEIQEPLIDLTFSRLMESGGLPPPPEEMGGMQLNVEFVSMLAQAQKAIGTNSVDRWVGNLIAIGGVKPEVLDKLDSDGWADGYADMTGVPPSMVVSSEKVQALRDARAKAMAAKEQLAAMEQQAGAMKDMAGSPTGGAQNALTDTANVMSGLTGYNSPGQQLGGGA